VFCRPLAEYFKPQGISLRILEEVGLTLDELEAVRLADWEGMYQESAAEKMKISRQTFGNIIISAHKKIADALLHGKALRIQGGVVNMAERYFICDDCKHEWTAAFGSGRPSVCPECNSTNIHRAPHDRGWGRGGGIGGGRGLRGGCRRL